MSLPHNVRLRPDLVIQPQDSVGGTWVVKDPISLRFFLFRGDERFILDRLDGRRSLEQIIDEFARERAPKRMTFERLQAFVATLHRNGLASSDAPYQGQIMVERADEQSWRESMLGWSNLLAIRLPGLNPDALLERLYRGLRWCFSWWFLVCMTIVGAIAGAVLVADWGTFSRALPQLHEFVGGRNLIWLGLALVLTKCLHELAHALTCRHFGGRCHEMGVILLVFMPCLYCNVTDAWMLRSRWQRIAISAAGMVLELFMAAIAVLIWRYTQPGPLNSVSLNVILVCGVSTLLFNGNPLLKHDGYYILSDLMRMPNLWQESRGYVYRQLRSWFSIEPRREEASPDHPWFLTAYAISSTVYRICLTIGILLFLHRALHPLGMEVLVIALIASIALQNVMVWSPPTLRWWKDPTKWKRLNYRAPIALGSLVAAIIAMALLMPLPASVTAPAVLQPRGATKVFVSSPGILNQAVAPGDKVEKGQTLALLENAELTNDRLIAASDLTRSQARVRTLQLRLNDDASLAAPLAVAQEILANLSEQANLRDKEFNRLSIASPRSGTVLLPPPVAVKADKKELPTWDGSPLDAENHGCYLERGTLLCLVGDPRKYEALVLIDETDMPYVKVDQTVRLKIEHAKDQILTGKLIEVSEVNAEAAPLELVSQRDVAVDNAHSQAGKPVRTLYQGRVEIDESHPPLLSGSRGEVRIEVAPQSLVQKLLHWARSTFSLNPKR